MAQDLSQPFRHPLVFPYNTREPNASIALTAAKDNRMIGVIPQIVDDPIKGEKAVYAAKRLGLTASATINAGFYGGAIYYNGVSIITGWANNTGLTTPTVFNGQPTNCGAIATDEVINSIIEVLRSGITYFMILAGNVNTQTGGGYFLASDSMSDPTFSGDTHTNTVIDNITGLTDTLYPGQPISGTGIAANTRIATVTSATAITTTIATTGTATITVTKTHLAKIIDADFPAWPVGSFVDKDGYLIFMDGSSNVWHMDLNSVYSISASSFIPATIKSGSARGCALAGNLICALKSRSIEFFRNAGNTLGSALSRTDPLYIDYGCKGSATGAAVTATIENNLYFIGNGFDGRTGIYVMDGATPRHISTSFIDSIIPNTAADAVYFSGNVMQGLKILYLNGATASYTTGGIAFYPDLGIQTQTAFPFDFIQNNGMFVSRNTTTGKIYLQVSSPSNSTYTDDSANFDSVLQFDSGDKGTGNSKTVEWYELIADTQTAGTAALAFSDDDGNNWTTFPNTIDLTAQQKRIKVNSMYYGRRFLRLTITGANRASRVRFLDEKLSAIGAT